MERCKLHRAQRIKLTEAGDKEGCDKVKFTKTEYQLRLPFVKFTKTEYQLRLPFVIFADFKSMLCEQDSYKPSSSKSFTTQYQHHVPCGSCIYVKHSGWWYFEPPQVNMEDDATDKFLDQVLAAATICRQHVVNKIPMKRLTVEQWRDYNNATNCSICTKPFKLVDKKVREHDHLMGEYKGPAHNTCNLNYRIDPKKVKIPCVIHNLKGILFQCYSYFFICSFLKLILIAILWFFFFLILIAIFISFYKFCKLYFVAILYAFCKLRFYAVSISFKVLSM